MGAQKAMLNAAEFLDNTELSDGYSHAQTLEILGARAGMSIAAMGASQDMAVSILESLESGGQLFHIEPGRAETRLPSHVCDRLLLTHVWRKLEDPLAALGEARRILRPQGRLIVIEWSPDGGYPPGPAPEERIRFSEMLQLLERTGWDVHRHGSAGVNSYFVEAAASDESIQS